MFKQAERDKRLNRDIRRYGSPTYTAELPAIVAGAKYGYNIDDHWPASRRYKPLTSLEVVNNDIIDLKIVVNGNTTLFVPHTSQKSWDELPLQTIIFENTSAVDSTAALVSISLCRPPIDADTIAREHDA
jgi:hypothetical protein